MTRADKSKRDGDRQFKRKLQNTRMFYIYTVKV